MRLTLWHAPALLLLYQAAPVHSRLDELGRFRLALGFGRGNYGSQEEICDESVGCSCSRSHISRARTGYSVVSGQGEAWMSETIRISAAGGLLSSSSDSSWAHVVDGGFATLLVAHEGEKFAYGGGLALWPRPGQASARVIPSVYLRFGRADRVHFRIDDNASAAPGSPTWLRLGLAKGFGQQLKPRWFLGVGAWGFDPGDNQARVYVGGELGVPVGWFQPMVTGGLSFHQDTRADWNVGVGLRAVLGRKP